MGHLCSYQSGSVERQCAGTQIRASPFPLHPFETCAYFSGVRKRVVFKKGGFGRCSPGTKTGTRVQSDVPPERNRNEGTFACSPGTKNRNEGTLDGGNSALIMGF